MASPELGVQLRSAVKILVDSLINPLSSRVLLDRLYEVNRKRRVNLPTIVIHLVSNLDKIEDLIRVCVDNVLEGVTSDPGLIFRGENINTKILAELCKMVCGTFVQALIKNEIIKLISKKKSEAKIRGHTQQLLNKIFNEMDYFPEAFTRLCAVVDKKIFSRYPDISAIGMANLVFLRFIFPVMIETSTSVIAKYP